MTQREKVTSLENRLRHERAHLDYLGGQSWSETARRNYLTQNELVRQLENLLCDERGVLIRESLAA